MLKQLLEDHRLDILTQTDIPAATLDRWIADPQTMRGVDVATIYPVMQVVGMAPDEFLDCIYNANK